MLREKEAGVTEGNDSRSSIWDMFTFTGLLNIQEVMASWQLRLNVKLGKLKVEIQFGEISAYVRHIQLCDWSYITSAISIKESVK